VEKGGRKHLFRSGEDLSLDKGRPLYVFRPLTFAMQTPLHTHSWLPIPEPRYYIILENAEGSVATGLSSRTRRLLLVLIHLNGT